MSLSATILALLAAGPGPTPELTGRWARLQVTAAVSEVPVIGEVSSETRALSIVDLRRRGDGYVVREQVCGLENESLGGAVRARFPAPFLRALGAPELAAEVHLEAGVLRYEEVRPSRVRGAALADPAADPLPADTADPRLVDADGDGQPGLTVKIEGLVDGEVYVVQRDSSTLLGRVLAPDHIRGAVRWRAEQEVLGASRDVLATNPDNRPHPEPGRSRFEMRRIPARATCPQLLRRVATLFTGA
jgi:hypothetical protein